MQTWEGLRELWQSYKPSTADLSTIEPSKSPRPCPLQFPFLQMPIHFTKPLPAPPHPIHLSLKTLWNFQLAEPNRPRIFGPLAQRNISLLLRQPYDLFVLAAVTLAVIAGLGAAVRMSVVGAAKLPGAGGTGGGVLVLGTGDEVFIAGFAGPAVGELGEGVGTVFAAPLDAHFEGKAGERR